MPQKLRLDLYLLTKGLVNSRQQAQRLIRAGKVRTVSGQLLDKPGYEVSEGLEVNVKNPPRFVSRGGEKLNAALKSFPLNVEGRVCIDGGISTGGFTDCLLQHGAKRVYGIDVGYGQTAWSIRTDTRVTLFERTNLRKLNSNDLYREDDQRATLAVADLSFISLRLVLPVIKELLLKDESDALLLVKPQFEVGRARVGKGGVVKDAAAHIDALRTVINSSDDLGWKTKGLVASPITGPAGNHEYLLWLGMDESYEIPDLENLVKETLS